MDKRNQLISPQAPAQDLTTFSFCKPAVRDLKAWIQGLPKANLGELARLLYQALTELNRLQASAELRLQLLEVIRPEVSFITRQLEKNHLQQSIILDERARKVANLCQALQNMQTTGYKLCLAQQPAGRNSLLPYAIHRSIHSLYSALARAYLLFYPIPAGLWFELHQLYLLARKHSLQTLRLKDSLLDGPKDQSIEEAYCCALLLGCSRINQMRQKDIVLLSNWLPNWSPLTSIQSVDASDTLFVVAPHSDTPPRYKALLNITGNEQLIGFNSKALAGKLEEWVRLPAGNKNKAGIIVPPRAQPTFIYQLCSAWGDIAKRDFKRVPGSGSLELCLGMMAVHYYLADKTGFDDTLLKPHSSKASYSLDNSEPDVWANAFDASSTGEDSLDEIIEYTPQASASGSVQLDAQQPSYPLYTVTIVNHSPGGYCLEWPENAPSQLQAGDIIGLRAESEQSWATAVIRWIRQIRNGGAQIGVELMAPNAQPCGLQLLRPGEEASNYLRCLMVPALAAISRPATLITPRVPFQEGSRVNINNQGEESRATLGKRSVHTASISQYEYSVSAPAYNPAPTAESGSKKTAQTSFATIETKTGNPADDFSSLWKVL